MDNLIKKYQFRCLILVIIISTILSGTYGQNIISDPKGITSIPLNPGFKATNKEDVENKSKIEETSFNLGLIKFTTTDKKLDFNNYGYFHPKDFTDFFIGFSGSGEIKNSITNLLSSGEIVSGGEANIRLGIRIFKSETDWPSLLAGKKTAQEIQDVLDNKTRPASDLWLVTTGGFKGSSFKHFRQDSIFSKQVEKINFTGSEINIGLNYWNARIFNNTILGGATIGLRKTNNFDDLDEGTQEDTKIIMDSTTGFSRKILIKQTIYRGDYKESTVYPLNIDLYFVPHKLENIAFLGYSRTDISKTKPPKTKLGLGIFFLKNQNAFNPISGLTIDYSDVFNTDSSDDLKGRASKITIGITTRINIVNNRLRK